MNVGTIVVNSNVKLLSGAADILFLTFCACY